MLHQTRRTFVKSMAIGTTAVAVVRWPPPLEAAGDPVQPPPSRGWSGAPGQARYRIDGIPKVTGAKIYARDFRSADIPGWPRNPAYAYVLRAVHADRAFLGLNLDKLPEALRPKIVIQQQDLWARGVTSPWFDAPAPMLVEKDANPVYLGQPVAFLIFDDVDTYRAAFRLMQFDPSYIRYGAPTVAASGQVLGDPYYYIRFSQGGVEQFSQVWALSAVNPLGTTACDQLAKRYQEQIRAMLDDPARQGWRVFSSSTSTQTIDPMFMEPQTGMAYMRKAGDKRLLDLVVGTQSPDGDASTLCDVLQGPDVHPNEITLYSCYPGGGFGGRDTSLFSYFLGIIAAFVPGRPVRLEFDRFGQFQGGIKRNGSGVDQTFAVDANGKLQAVRSKLTIVGGGKQNYSPYVAELAGICGAGAYAVPLNDIEAVAVSTIGPTAGSMRGFGGPQAFFAVEHMMDQIAAELRIDPIELRLRNVLSKNDHTVTGAPITQPLLLREICERARETPLWKNRNDEKRRRTGGSTLYGVGFALANQAYGTGTDPVMARVAIEPDGRVVVTTNAVDMGNGSATALALATAQWLGTNASSIEMGDPAFYDVLNLTTDSTCPILVNPCATSNPAAATTIASASPKNPHIRSRGGHPKHATVTATQTSSSSTASSCPATPPPTYWTTNPCYTASIFASSSACVTAFQQMHAVEQASRVVFLTGILPAALRLWGAAANVVSAETVAWREGKLVAPGRRPLDRAALIAEIYRLGATTGATAHALYQGQWVTADWTIRNATYNLPIDALAVRSGKGEYLRLDRANVTAPPVQTQFYGRSLYAPSGTLAAVEIDRNTGAVRLVDVITWVDAGRPIQRQLLAGQYEGAVAMGFGYAFLESMPQGINGPGEGTWNLNRYGLALASDLPPLDRMQLVTLNESGPPRGIAEAVLCPIAPALANATAHATGMFYTSLPITMAKLREVRS